MIEIVWNLYFLQALYCTACNNDISIKKKDWHVIDAILSHLEIRGGVDGNEMERITIRVMTIVRVDIKENVKLYPLKLIYTDANYVYKSTLGLGGSYLPVWMTVGAEQVIRLIQLELKRKPKCIYN